jgi:hypothetical protein
MTPRAGCRAAQCSKLRKEIVPTPRARSTRRALDLRAIRGIDGLATLLPMREVAAPRALSVGLHRALQRRGRDPGHQEATTPASEIAPAGTTTSPQGGAPQIAWRCRKVGRTKQRRGARDRRRRIAAQ